MGYSNLQFGYWSREPVDPNDKNASPWLHHSNDSLREPAMAANNCMQCDVAIVGSGFAGALIANELSQKGIKVVILEAGPGVPPNINDYMKRFYNAAAKVPESPFPPKLKLKDTDVKLRDPAKVGCRQADGAVARRIELEGSRTKLSHSERPAALHQHLRTCRRRHVALARHLL